MTDLQSHDDTKTCGVSIHSSRPCTALTLASNNEMGGVIVFWVFREVGDYKYTGQFNLPFSILGLLSFSSFHLNISTSDSSQFLFTFTLNNYVPCIRLQQSLLAPTSWERGDHKHRRLRARHRDELSYLLYLRRRRKQRVDSLRQR